MEAAPPPPLDLSHHFSFVTRARQASNIKKYYKFFQIPGIGNLAGGNITIASPVHIHLTDHPRPPQREPLPL
jgi:hypothetical protein